MKIYGCNDELINIIRKYGFRESTNAYERGKGKKRFRKGKLSEMQIYFDYENFKMYEENRGCDAFDNNNINADDLRLLLWYVSSTAADREHISDGHYDLRTAKQSLQTMSNLLRSAKEFNHRNEDSLLFERLLAAHDAISLN